jgi:hypothetical protein
MFGCAGSHQGYRKLPATPAAQVISKPYRFTLTMPACVLVSAISLGDSAATHTASIAPQC